VFTPGSMGESGVCGMPDPTNLSAGVARAKQILDSAPTVARGDMSRLVVFVQVDEATKRLATPPQRKECIKRPHVGNNR
jgi:hypothetical protein